MPGAVREARYQIRQPCMACEVMLSCLYGQLRLLYSACKHCYASPPRSRRHGNMLANLPRDLQVWMPEVSEEGERVLKAKVSWAAAGNSCSPVNVSPTPFKLFAGPAILCSRGGRSACTVPMYIL